MRMQIALCVVCSLAGLMGFGSSGAAQENSRITGLTTNLNQFQINEVTALCLKAQEPLRAVKKANKLADSPESAVRIADQTMGETRKAMTKLGRLLSISPENLRSSALPKWKRIGQVAAMLKTEVARIDGMIAAADKQKVDPSALFKRLMTSLNYLNELIGTLRDLDPTP